MINYDIFYYCENCGQDHPAGIKIQIKNGPSSKMSVGAFYTGKSIPLEIKNTIDNYLLCPNTGKKVNQKDIYKIFFQPIV